MGCSARRGPAALPHGERPGRRVVRDRAGGACRLHWPQRRGQVHHRQGHLRHPGAGLRPLRDPGPRALEGARRPRSQHRRRLRTADPALVGPAGHRVVRAAEGYIQGSSLRLWPHAGRGCAGDGLGAAARRARAAAQPGPADAVRPRRLAAAPALDPLPGRADNRPGRGVEAGVPRLHQALQPRPRGHRHPHHARHGRHRGPLHPRHGHRRGAHPLRRHAGGPPRADRAGAQAYRPPRGARRRGVRPRGHSDAARGTLSFDPRRTPPADLIARIASRHAVRDLFVESLPIEEIVARMYAEEGQ